MTLSDILNPECVIPEMHATDRWQAIDELLAQLVKAGRIQAEHLPAITQAVKKRETTMSTGIGFGIGCALRRRTNQASSNFSSPMTSVFTCRRKGWRR